MTEEDFANFGKCKKSIRLLSIQYTPVLASKLVK
jgi:hypothetical protein